MTTPNEPKYPIRIDWPEDGPEFYKNELERRCDVEWFDSEDKAEPIGVYDADGRPVLLLMEALELIKLKLKQ